jgi:hypothetical protein
MHLLLRELLFMGYLQPTHASHTEAEATAAAAEAEAAAAAAAAAAAT